MLAVDFTHTIPDDYTTATTTQVASSACTQAVATVDSSAYCAFTSTLEIWDEDKDDWYTWTTGDTAS